MRVAFVGLGNMGTPMAANLVKAGHRVTGFDLSEAARDAAAASGVPIAPSAAAAAGEAEVVITMLPAGRHVLAVYDELLPAAPTGALFLDCSTVDVESARAAHGRAAAAGMASLDAPVSGGVGGATAGTLTFMVGGAEAAFETARPLFEAMGKKAVHCGGAGAGQAAKICNNMLLGISMIGACEAFNLADRLGLDRARLYDVVSTSSGQCWSVTTYCPVPGVGPESPADNDYRPGFAAALMLKDLTLSQMAAEGCECPTPLGAHATALYEAFAAAGGAGEDFSGIIRYLARQAR
jgi:3-hydroxyisobutyrate dehydrogenase